MQLNICMLDGVATAEIPKSLVTPRPAVEHSTQPITLQSVRKETHFIPENIRQSARQLSLCSFNCYSRREGGEPVHAKEIGQTISQLATQGTDVFMLEESPLPAKGNGNGSWLSPEIHDEFDIFSAGAPRDRGAVALLLRKGLLMEGSVTVQNGLLPSKGRNEHKGSKGYLIVTGKMLVNEKPVPVSFAVSHLELFSLSREFQAQSLAQAVNQATDSDGKKAEMVFLGADVNNFLRRTPTKGVMRGLEEYLPGIVDHFDNWATASVTSSAFLRQRPAALLDRIFNRMPHFNRDTIFTRQDGHQVMVEEKETVRPKRNDGKDVSDHFPVLLTTFVQ